MWSEIKASLRTRCADSESLAKTASEQAQDQAGQVDGAVRDSLLTGGKESVSSLNLYGLPVSGTFRFIPLGSLHLSNYFSVFFSFFSFLFLFFSKT